MTGLLTLTRKQPGWPELMDAYLARTEHTPFAWGKHDCCTFVCDGATAITGGFSPMADLAGTYQSERGAYRLIRDAGGLQHLVTERFGIPLASPLLAQRGDAVLVDQDGTELLALCLGSTWTAAGATGRVTGSMEAAVVAWRV